MHSFGRLLWVGVFSAIALRAGCATDAATYKKLSEWRVVYEDARLTFEQQMSPLWNHIVADPGNVALHHAYQHPILTYIGQLRRPPVEQSYRDLLTRYPDNIGLKYAYGRFLVMYRNAEAKEILDEVVAKEPEFPWAYLVLARLHTQTPYTDQNRQREFIRKFFSLCPSVLERDVYETVTATMPPEFRLQLAIRLRELIGDSVEPRMLSILPALWQLEFQRPAAEHAEVRKQVAADLRRLRHQAGDDLALLKNALQGYSLIDDREGARWARERIAAEHPHSRAAANYTIERWYSDRRRPTLEDSRERVEGYYGELLEATNEWVRKWPLFEDPWSSRFRALRELPDQPAGLLMSAGVGLLRASEAGDSNWFVAPSLTVATVFAQRDTGIHHIPALLDRNARDSAARVQADQAAEWMPESMRAANVRSSEESLAEARVLRVRLHLRNGQREQALALVRELEQQVAAHDGHEFAIWKVRPHLVTARIAVRDYAAARNALRPLEQWLQAKRPAESAGRYERTVYRENEALYSQKVAELAAAEHRNRDAAIAYQRTLQLRQDWPALADRFAMFDEAQRLWAASGGSEDEWKRWNGSLASAVYEPSKQWETLNRTMPDFSLSDLSGRKWTTTAIMGKRTLINFWATWCGPCVAELPYIAKLASAVTDRKDILVLTLNIDENPGVIDLFLNRHGLTALTVLPAHDFVLNTLNVNGFPRTWIVDDDGVVRREQVGFTGEPAKWFDSTLATLTAPNPRPGAGRTQP